MGSVIQEVALHKVRFFSPIGYYEEERILGNEFFVDVSVYFPFRNPDAEELTNTVNYEELYHLTCAVMKKERKLLESAAEELLSGIQARYSFLDEVRVSIRKTTPPFGHDEVQTVVSLHYRT
ncbi:dihydroneopterin aldolase [Sphingobacterium sp. SGR-19]|uniref:dihydroneopterin aldolase n=1 Tax=Sphingobacterium sp. SGR-19 TaxID=2710886 RepID=UPI0013EC080C|nr:dihydroneopterin aldolase [Sphingobacterium sp. SGR-19]NGM66941.1 dihydroneopterin aldolase [Sphingobacterium sp. SGR-19]